MTAAAKGQIRAWRMDVSSEDAWLGLASDLNECDGIYGLVNVAGVANRVSHDSVSELSRAAWDHVIGTNLTGVWLGMKTAISLLRPRGNGGRIVNVASLAGVRGLPAAAAYSASKGGVIALTRQAAVDYGPDGILINCVSPGQIDTPMARATAEIRRQRQSSSSRDPGYVLGRAGHAGEVASAIAFLLSDATYITGQNLCVDGGWHARA
jgi:NAD(P)-dependent dehydrogenase (short-subunit alcohol dehydrogenase family)